MDSLPIVALVGYEINIKSIKDIYSHDGEQSVVQFRTFDYFHQFDEAFAEVDVVILCVDEFCCTSNIEEDIDLETSLESIIEKCEGDGQLREIYYARLTRKPIFIFHSRGYPCIHTKNSSRVHIAFNDKVDEEVISQRIFHYFTSSIEFNYANIQNRIGLLEIYVSYAKKTKLNIARTQLNRINSAFNGNGDLAPSASTTIDDKIIQDDGLYQEQDLMKYEEEEAEKPQVSIQAENPVTTSSSKNISSSIRQHFTITGTRQLSEQVFSNFKDDQDFTAELLEIDREYDINENVSGPLILCCMKSRGHFTTFDKLGMKLWKAKDEFVRLGNLSSTYYNREFAYATLIRRPVVMIYGSESGEDATSAHMNLLSELQAYQLEEPVYYLNWDMNSIEFMKQIHSLKEMMKNVVVSKKNRAELSMKDFLAFNKASGLAYTSKRKQEEIVSNPDRVTKKSSATRRLPAAVITTATASIPSSFPLSSPMDSCISIIGEEFIRKKVADYLRLEVFNTSSPMIKEFSLIRKLSLEDLYCNGILILCVTGHVPLLQMAARELCYGSFPLHNNDLVQLCSNNGYLREVWLSKRMNRPIITVLAKKYHKTEKNVWQEISKNVIEYDGEDRKIEHFYLNEEEIQIIRESIPEKQIGRSMNLSDLNKIVNPSVTYSRYAWEVSIFQWVLYLLSKLYTFCCCCFFKNETKVD